MATIAALYRYPIKGLSAEPLAKVRLEAGQGLPLDRRFALARPAAPFDPAAPRWLPKTNFLMLMKDERLASLRATYDDTRGILRIEHRGELMLSEDLRSPGGRERVEEFFLTFMGDQIEGRPRLVEAPGHAFTDCAKKYVSLISLESLRDLERVVGQPVHPLRLRGNLYVDGLPAWAELDWVGKLLSVEGSPIRFRVADRIDRCAATNVDPVTARRDMNLPLALRRRFGHLDCGVYLEVRHGGDLTVGQTLAEA